MKENTSGDGEVARGGSDPWSARCVTPQHVQSLPVGTSAGTTMKNEVMVAGSVVGVAREGWRITGKWVGAGEQRKRKFDTNVSVLPSKSSQCSSANRLLWLGFLESHVISLQYPD